MRNKVFKVVASSDRSASKNTVDKWVDAEYGSHGDDPEVYPGEDIDVIPTDIGDDPFGDNEW